MSSLLAIGQIAAGTIAAGAMVIAAESDVRRYEIPDGCAIIVAVTAAGFAVSQGAASLIWAILMGTGIFAVGAVFFARGWLGGGDVKLLAAVALWIPQSLIASFALVTSLTGATLSLAFLTPLRRFLPAPPCTAESGVPAGEDAGTTLRQPIPFGIAIAAGGIFILCRRLLG